MRRSADAQSGPLGREVPSRDGDVRAVVESGAWRRRQTTAFMQWMDERLRADPRLARAVAERLEEMRREADAFEARNRASTPGRNRWRG